MKEARRTLKDHLGITLRGFLMGAEMWCRGCPAARWHSFWEFTMN